LKAPDEWLKEPQYQGITVLDPDGWDRTDFETSWREPIDEAEFRRRLFASTLMTDDSANRTKINAWIDGWMIRLNDRTKEYQAQGLSLEEATDRATFDTRMEIRRAPPLELD